MMNNVKKHLYQWWGFITESYFPLAVSMLSIHLMWYFSRPYDGWPTAFLLCLCLAIIVAYKTLYDTAYECRKVLEAAKAQNVDLNVIENDGDQWESIEIEKLNDYKQEVLRLREIIEKHDIDGEYHKAYIKKSECKIKPVKRSYSSLIVVLIAIAILLAVDFFSEDEQPDLNTPQPLSSPYYKDSK